MKTVSLSIFFLIVLLSSAFATDIHYDVTINDPSTHRASIKMKVDNLQSTKFTVQKYYGPCDTRILVTSLKVSDVSGKELPVTFKAGDERLWDPDLWSVNSFGKSALVVEYVIETRLPEENSQAFYNSYIGSDFAVFVPADMYLAPPLDMQINKLTTTFAIPQEWSLVCAWKSADGVYDMKSTKADVEPRRPYTSSIIGMGKLDVSSRQIGNASVTVATYAKWPNDHKRIFENNIWSLYSYFSSVWGNSLDQPYVAICCPFADDGKWINGGTTEAGIIYSMPTSTAADSHWYAISIEMNETRWTGYNWGFTSNYNCTWYYSGGASYQAISAFASKVIQQTNNDYAVEFLFDLYNTYYQQYVMKGKDISLSSMKPENDDHVLPRTKGTLATFLFAKEIYERTNGKYTINDLNKVFVMKYWGTGTFITEKDFKREIETLTNSDFTEFFDKYVYGTTKYPFDWAELDDDDDGVSNAVEILRGTDPSSKNNGGEGKPTNATADELVLNFGPTYGLWHYDQAGGWKQWNTVNPSHMVTVDLNGDGTDELVAAFPGYGLYKRDSANDWQKINDVEPNKMIAADIDGDGKDEVVAGFIGYGLYYYDDPGVWTPAPINTVIPDAMVRYSDGVVCDFGAAYGLWSYNTSAGWVRLNAVDPDKVVAADLDGDGKDELVVSFAGWGLYTYEPVGGWQKINAVIPDQIMAVDIDNDGQDELVVSFAGYGLYTYEPVGSIWVQVNTVIPENMTRQGNGIAVDFGATYGLWYWDASGGWVERNTVDPGQMTVVDIDKDGVEELVVSFSGYGLYYFDETNGWQLLNTVVPVGMKPINFYP